jgi:predicted nuclease of predicted toxin-antitoxin system
MKCFFFDNNVSKKIVEGLKAFGEEVVHLQDKFPEDSADIEWLQYVGEKGFVLITRDERVRRNPAEMAAIRKFKVATFFLGGSHLDRCKLIQQVVRNWPRIKELSGRTQPPFAYRIPPTGTKFTQIPL